MNLSSASQPKQTGSEKDENLKNGIESIDPGDGDGDENGQKRMFAKNFINQVIESACDEFDKKRQTNASVINTNAESGVAVDEHKEEIDKTSASLPSPTQPSSLLTSSLSSTSPLTSPSHLSSSLSTSSMKSSPQPASPPSSSTLLPHPSSSPAITISNDPDEIEREFLQNAYCTDLSKKYSIDLSEHPQYSGGVRQGEPPNEIDSPWKGVLIGTIVVYAIYKLLMRLFFG